MTRPFKYQDSPSSFIIMLVRIGFNLESYPHAPKLTDLLFGNNSIPYDDHKKYI